MTINTPGWPLGADITCAICGTAWTIHEGDAARIVVAPVAGTITVDAACPGCDTLYTATKTIGAHRSPDWMMAEQQSNVEEPEPTGDPEDIAGAHVASVGEELYVEPIPDAKPAAPPKGAVAEKSKDHE